MTTRTLNLNDNIIDSRDIIERLQALREEAIAVLEATPPLDDDDYIAEDALDAMIDAGTLDIDPEQFWDTDELLLLSEINQDGENTFSDWTFGVALISEDYFEDYAEEFANDIGVIDNRNGSLAWPLYCIDWKEAASDLKQDYQRILIDGNEYWGR